MIITFYRLISKNYFFTITYIQQTIYIPTDLISIFYYLDHLNMKSGPKKDSIHILQDVGIEDSGQDSIRAEAHQGSIDMYD